jgi:hypothetical protein
VSAQRARGIAGDSALWQKFGGRGASQKLFSQIFFFGGGGQNKKWTFFPFFAILRPFRDKISEKGHLKD